MPTGGMLAALTTAPQLQLPKILDNPFGAEKGTFCRVRFYTSATRHEKLLSILFDGSASFVHHNKVYAPTTD
jgi:hypothetical protein